MSDTYLIATESKVQTLSGSQGFSTLLRDTVSGMGVQYMQTQVLGIPPAGTVTVSLGSIARLKLVVVKSTSPVDVALVLGGVDAWSGVAGDYYFRVFSAAPIVDGIKITAAAAAQVEVKVAGMALV